MEINRLFMVYFSPTQTTKKISMFIGKGLSLRVPSTQINNTDTSARSEKHTFEKDDLLIVGAPCYGGRLPVVTPEIFGNLYGNKTPVILYVTYGNRGYDDELLELKEFLESRNFICISAGAFVTKHASSDLVGLGRPNEDDLKMAKELGVLSKEKLALGIDEILQPNIPGNKPFKDLPPASTVTPITNSKCVLCLLCFRWCPVDAINPDDPNITDASKCIRCQGCVRRCPVDAREIVNEEYLKRIEMFDEKFKDNNCTSELFL